MTEDDWIMQVKRTLATLSPTSSGNVVAEALRQYPQSSVLRSVQRILDSDGSVDDVQNALKYLNRTRPDVGNGFFRVR